jgi:hypothetical protein
MVALNQAESTTILIRSALIIMTKTVKGEYLPSEMQKQRNVIEH